MASKRKLPSVMVKCIVCGSRREVWAGEVAPGGMPMCGCGNVMIAEASTRHTEEGDDGR